MSQQAKEELKKILSEEQISQNADTLKEYGKDWLSIYQPAPSMVLFPKSHQSVEDIVKWALRYNIALVPSGGRTGLSGGSVALRQEVVLSFERMNQILEFNEQEQSLTVQAGVITQRVQEKAREKSFYFPLSFASEGSSHIGGNASTNAGGVHVIRHGCIRKWITGLKVVTGQGKSLCLGKGLIKNQAGYDLLQLFIGSEGTLALITEVTLKLAKKPEPSMVFLFSVPDLKSLMEVYCLFKAKLSLRAFEMFTDRAVEYAQKNSSFPLKQKSPYYALIECDQSQQESALLLFESALEKAYIQDGVVGENPKQAKELWAFRENISESLSPYFPYKNDICIRISCLPDFLSEMNKTLSKEYPDFTVVWFGHIGDGNLHINVLKPQNMAKDQFLKHCERVNQMLFSLVKKYKGSISAEHGVGLLKKPYLSYSCSEAEIMYMKAIKKVFDPKGLLNPGKIFDESQGE